jgi:hypothetical protein
MSSPVKAADLKTLASPKATPDQIRRARGSIVVRIYDQWRRARAPPLHACPKRLVAAIIDAKPHGQRGLPTDPSALRRLVGLESAPPPSPLADAKLSKSCVSLICGKAAWNPAPLVSRLRAELDEARLVDLALALLDAEDPVAASWTQGKTGEKFPYSMAEAEACARRRARVFDLCFELLAGMSDGHDERLEQERAPLEKRRADAEAIGRSVLVWWRHRAPIELYALVLATRAVAAKRPIPKALRETLVAAAVHGSETWAHRVRALLPSLGKEVDAFLREVERLARAEHEKLTAGVVGHELWCYADLGSVALAPDLVKSMKQSLKDNDVPREWLKRVAGSLAERGRAADADGIMRLASQYTFDDGTYLHWKTADGAELKIAGSPGRPPYLDRPLLEE